MKIEKKYQKRKTSRKGLGQNHAAVLQDITSSLENAAMDTTQLSLQTSSPNSSQSMITPSTSPQTSSPSIRQPKSQLILSVGIDERKLCDDCGMSYLKNVKTDIKMHQKYHQKCLNGRDWNQSWGSRLVNLNQNEYICCVNPKNLPETKAALELLEIVNRDLNAPDDNQFWLKGEDHGKVFVWIWENKAVAVVSVERIKYGKWFSVDDGKIVSALNVELLAGINRIYVCKNHRRHGIALQLLEAVQEFLIYGMFIPRIKIGWSQPSFSGGKLAKTFNGVKHKSGKVLIPVYT